MNKKMVVTGISPADTDTDLELPVAEASCPAGFPSPADDYMEDKLDLNEHLIENPAATFFVRVSGTSMKNAGIHDGDILIVDRSLEARHGKVVIAVVDGELSVKRLRLEAGDPVLEPENPDYESIKINRENDLRIWGVVTTVIHEL
ncbi:MAG: LexA family protein [bacterium]